MFELQPIGYIKNAYQENPPEQPTESDQGYYLEFNTKYIKALKRLELFNYIYVIYHFDQLKVEPEIKMTEISKDGEEIGLFATRNQIRPNPIGLSVVKLIDIKENRIYISGIDALNGTPILDIKPYIKDIDLKEDANNGWQKKIANDWVCLYTDGACSGNPGPGGYAAIIVKGKKEQIIKGYSPETTNNRMELQAVIEGLKEINSGSKVKLHADSNYVLQGLNNWLDGWKARGWKTASNRPVKNQDLWQQLDQLRQHFLIDFIKIKGHSGHEYNEKADSLAREQIEIEEG